MKPSTALPATWQDDLLDRADLEASYSDLEGYGHYIAESMRGHVRSLQLRVKEAEAHLVAAKAAAFEEPEDIPTLVNVFNIETSIFYNALLKGPILEPAESPEDPWLPGVPDHLLDRQPEVKQVLLSRRATEAVFRLHLGEFETAQTYFEDLIDIQHGRDPDGTLYGEYLGLSACFFNLGDETEGERNLENAALAIQHGGRLLNQALGAGRLSALCEALGESEEAAGWRVFLERLDCPPETKRVTLERGDRMVERCFEQGYLVLL